VDAKLVALARRLQVQLLTVDSPLQRVAELQGVHCLNIDSLSEGLRKVHVPGETLRLPITRQGKEPGQGVGFLDDGTMVVVVDAAGAGERFGGAKQFAALGDRRVLDWSVAGAADACDGVVVVLPPGTGEAPDPVASPGPTPPPTTTVTGGATRSASVRAGLALVPDDAHVVVVHDGARPLAGPALFRAVIAAVRSGADGAVPGVRPADTIK